MDITNTNHSSTSSTDSLITYKACIGCGYCCMKSPCAVSLFAKYWKNGSCQALKWNGKRYVCLYIIDAKEIKRTEREFDLAIGAGCCSSMNTWRNEVKNRDDEDITLAYWRED